MSTLLERWRAAEAIDLYRVVLETAPAGKAYDVSKVLAVVVEELLSNPGVVGSPNAYARLSTTVDGELRGQLSSAAKAAFQGLGERLQDTRESWGAWRAARATSYLISTTPATPEQFLAVGHVVAPKYWRQATIKWPDEVRRAIAVLHEPGAACAEKLRRLQELDDKATECLPDRKYATVAAWVRNDFLVALMRRLFTWPLVVARFADGVPVGIAVPLGLDVRYPSVPQARFNEYGAWPTVAVKAESDAESQMWLRAASRAQEAAYWIWRSRHGYHGREARSIKRLAELSVDCAQADALMRPLIQASVIVGNASENGEDDYSSAEAYLAVQIFGHHIRRPLSTATAITGRLGEPIVAASKATSTSTIAEITNSDLSSVVAGRSPSLIADYELGLAADLMPKLEFCRRTEIFSRVVGKDVNVASRSESAEPLLDDGDAIAQYLRNGRGQDDESAESPSSADSSRVNPATSILEAARVSSLQEAVRIAFGNRASPQLHIRLPDHIGGERPGEVKPLLVERLRLCDQTVLAWDGSVDDVLATLRFVDTRLRHEADLARRTPPRFSWVAADLSGVSPEQAWYLLWDYCDGDLDSLTGFLRAIGDAGRLAAVEELMNRFAEEAADYGHRAPDLLVLRIWSNEMVPTGDSLLDPERLLKAARLSRSTDDRLDPFLGRARVVVVRDSRVSDGETIVPSPRLNTVELQEDFDALRVFRDSIDVHVAARFLARVGPGHPSERLSALLETGFVRRAGWKLSLPIDQRGSYSHLSQPRSVQAHVAALLALLPFLNLNARLPTDIDRGQSSEALVEACWHARVAERAHRVSRHEAADATSVDSALRVDGVIQHAVAVLYGAALPPSWANVEVLTSHEPVIARRILERLVDSSDEMTQLEVPRLLVGAAALLKGRGKGATAAEQQRAAERLIDCFIDRAGTVAPEIWARSASLALGAFEPEEYRWAELSDIVVRGLTVLRARHAVPPFHVNNRWALHWCGAEGDHRAAISRYDLMIYWVRTPVQLLIEQFGARLRTKTLDPATRRRLIVALEQACGADRDGWFQRVRKRLISGGRAKTANRAPTPVSVKRGLLALNYLASFYHSKS